MSNTPLIKIAGKGCVLDAGEGQKSPPLPFIEVDESTARALIGTGVAVLVGEGLPAEDEGEAERRAAEEAEVKRLADETAREAEEAEAKRLATEEAARLAAEQGGDKGEGDNGADKQPDPAAARRQTIVDALDLLEPDQLVKTGPRIGKPTLKAMEEITGIEDLSVAEIDAVIAAKEAE